MTAFDGNWEQRAVDEEVSLEETGLADICPVCGSELDYQGDTWNHAGFVVEVVIPFCRECGWEGNPRYDAE